MALNKKQKEIKAKWLAALRSGKYSQTHSTLFRSKEDATDKNPAGYCCLGVLQHVLDGGVSCQAVPSEEGTLYPQDSPDKAWYKKHGIGSAFLKYRPELDTSLETMCILANDSQGKNFKQIADMVEERWV